MKRMNDSIAELIERQCTIIEEQAKTINALYQILEQHVAAEEMEMLATKANIAYKKK